MYMSRIMLDRTRRETMLALASPNKIHGAVEACFPGERRRKLWRIDELDQQSYLLVVSEDAPSLNLIAGQFAPEGASWEIRSYDAFLAAIQAGSRWYFRLAANPTVSRADKEGNRGKVLAHVTVQQQKQWLLDRSQKHGFDLNPDEFDVVKRNVLTFEKGVGRYRVTMGTCVFEGMLTVMEEELIRKALTEGLGRGKAYGLGLLTIAKR